MTESEAAAWVAGFVDGEGCVYYRRELIDGRHHDCRVMTLTNTDLALIEFMAQCLDRLGIEYGRGDRPGASAKHKHRYLIEIRKGAALWRFRDLVPIQAPEKRRRLDAALESYRGLHCFGCGCLHDERTPGCTNCRKRFQMRGYAQASRDRVSAASSQGHH